MVRGAFKPFRPFKGTMKAPKVVPDVQTSSLFRKVSSVLDNLNRLQYAVGGAITAIQEGKPEQIFRRVKEGFIDKKQYGGEEILERAGMRPGLKRTAAGLALSILTDPLTWAGGVGALTKTGKAARILASAQKAAKLGGKVSRFGKYAIAAKKAGKLLPLAKTAAEQAQLGQRALLSLRIPFTKIGVPLIRGEGAFRLAARMGAAARINPITRTLIGLFKRTTGDPELDKLLFGRVLPEMAYIKGRGLERAARVSKLLQKAAKAGPVEVTEEARRAAMLRIGERLEGKIIKPKTVAWWKKMAEKEAPREVLMSRLREAVEKPGRRAELLIAARGGDEGAKLILEAVPPSAKTVARGAGKFAKKPWQMTRKEFNLWEEKVTRSAAFKLKSGEIVTGIGHGDIAARDARVMERGSIAGWERGGYFIPSEGAREVHSIHEAVVQDALMAGRSVPAKVLAEYPDLAKVAPTAMKMSGKSAQLLLQAVEETRGAFGEMLKSQRRAGVSSKALSEYFPHFLTKDARKMAHIPEKAHPLIQRVVSGGMSVDEANKAARAGAFGEAYASVPKMFEDDPIKLIALRAGITANIVAPARLRRFVPQVSRGAVEVDDMIGRGKLITDNPGTDLYLVSRRGIARLTPEVPLAEEVIGAGAKIHAIPRDIGEQLRRFWVTVTEPTEMEKMINSLFKTYDVIHGRLRVWTLAYFPSYYIRNGIGNLFACFLGGLRNPAYYVKAAGLQSGKLKKVRLAGLAATGANVVEEAKRFGVLETGQYVSRELVKGGLLPHTRFLLDKAGKGMENNARLALYLWARDQGMNALDAAMHVKKYLFDYEDLSTFERMVLRRITFFYTWARKMMGLLIGEAFKQPSVLSIPEKARQASFKMAGVKEEELPEWMIGRGAFIAGKAGRVVKTGLLQSWLPSYELERLAGLLSGGFGTQVGSAAEMVTPLLRTPAEFAFGKSLYYGKPLEAYPGERREFLRQWVPAKVAYGARTIRLLNEIDRALRSNMSVADKAVTLGTGVRLYKVNLDEERTRREAQLRALKALLLRWRKFYTSAGRFEEVKSVDAALKKVG